MSERILGVDVSGPEVRLVRMEASLGRAAVSGFAEAAADGAGGPAEAAGRLARERDLDSDLLVVGLRTDYAYYRRLSFPFNSPAKIREVLAMEMEAELPMPADDAALDMLLSRPEGRSGQRVLAAALPRKDLHEVLEAFEAAGLRADGVDVAADALNELAKRLGKSLPDKVLLLHVGLESACLLLRLYGRPAAMRGLPMGLGQFGGPGAARPDAWREALASQAPADGERLADRLAAEVAMTLAAAAVEPSAVDMLVLSGDGAEMPWLLDLLVQKVEMPVKRLSEIEGLNLPVESNGAGDLPVDRYAVALGLALRGAPSILGGDAGLNFHVEGRLAGRRSLDLRRALWPLASLAAVLLLGFGVSTAVDIQLKRARLAEIEQRARGIVTRALPDVRPNQGLAQLSSIMRSRVQELRQADGQRAGGLSAMALLADISRLVPPDMQVTLTTLYMDEGVVRLSGGADAFSTVERLKQALAGVQGFGNVQIRTATAESGGKGVQFQVEMTRDKAGS